MLWVDTINPQYLTSMVHVVGYNIFILLQKLRIWMTTNLGEGGGYITGMADVTRVDIVFMLDGV